MIRMHWSNKSLLFPEYRKRTVVYLIYKMIRYCMFFQVLFYSVMGNYFFLGSMDHLLSRSQIVSATNKDSIHIGRCTALYDVIQFNGGSWRVSLFMICLAYATWLQPLDWDYTVIPDIYNKDHLNALLFSGPAAFMGVLAFIVPLILNPFVIGWPFNPPLCGRRKVVKKPQKLPERTSRKGLPSTPGGKVVDLRTFMSTDAATKLENEAARVNNRQDVELGSLATYEMGGVSKGSYPISVARPEQSPDQHVRRSRNPNKMYGGNDQRLQKTRSEPPNKQAQSAGATQRTSRTSSTDANKNRVKLAMI